MSILQLMKKTIRFKDGQWVFKCCKNADSWNHDFIFIQLQRYDSDATLTSVVARQNDAQNLDKKQSFNDLNRSSFLEGNGRFSESLLSKKLYKKA